MPPLGPRPRSSYLHPRHCRNSRPVQLHTDMPKLHTHILLASGSHTLPSHPRMPPAPSTQMHAGGIPPRLLHKKSNDFDCRSNSSYGSDGSTCSSQDVTQMISDFTRDSLSKAGSGDKKAPLLNAMEKLRSSTPSARSPQPKRPPSANRYTWKLGDIYPIILGKLHFTCAAPNTPPSRLLRCSNSLVVVNSELPKHYFSFCKDFGPNNLAIVLRFCEYLSGRMAAVKASRVQLVYRASDESRIRTNTAFLLAAFLVIEKNYSPEEAVAPFEAITPYPFLGYRDATNAPATFEISILDCLHGLVKARSCGWFEPMKFNLQEYEYWDTPTNGDFHQVSPKFIAFKGPVDAHMEQEEYCHDPAHYIRPFQKRGVSAVVRLNEPDSYDAKAFKLAGIKHYDLFFQDCTVPTDDQVREFMAIVDSEPGVVAVHCRAGLGRTGTLIGAFIMRRHGFTARESISWLRMCRPGCVIGPQQQFLASLEAHGWLQGKGRQHEDTTGSGPATPTPGLGRDLPTPSHPGKGRLEAPPRFPFPLQPDCKPPPRSRSPYKFQGSSSSTSSTSKASDLAEQVSKGMLLRAKVKECSDREVIGGLPVAVGRQSWPSAGASVRRASTSGSVRASTSGCAGFQRVFSM